MKLTLLTQYYPPETGAPQTRLSHLAREFARAGHEVTVLTAMPNYPTGKIFPGYGGWLKCEFCDQMKVLRTFVFPAQSARLFTRMASYLSFVISSALVGTALLGRCDYLMVESPPLFLGLAGVWLSWLKQARLIFNVSDLWPESAVRLGIVGRESRLHRWARRLESFCYHRAWLITCQTRAIRSDIAGRFPDLHFRMLSNGADTEVFHPARATAKARAALTQGEPFVVLFAGLHGLAQGLQPVLEAARELEREGGYRFVLVGDGPEKQSLIRWARESRCQSVTFMDPLPAARVPALLAAADALLVPLTAQFEDCVPCKLYEAMASGRPVVLAAGGEAAAMLCRHEAGIVVKPGDAESLATAVRELRANPARAREMGENGRRAILQDFDRGKIARGLIEYLSSQTTTLARQAQAHDEATLGA